MGNFMRLLIINIVIIIVLIGGGAAGYYYYNQATSYVKTDNASVSGQSISITAPASGELTSWTSQLGKYYGQNHTLGVITGAGTGASARPTQTAVKMPQNATIALNSGVKNTMVAAGTQLAEAFDMHTLYINANVNETDIHRIKNGQKVDVSIDAFPGENFTGKVSSIGTATASTFSLISNSNSNGNYTKVTQVIPVKITLDDFKGDELVPGMNATVKIHV